MQFKMFLLTFLTFLYSVHGSPTIFPSGYNIELSNNDFTGRIVNGTKAVLGQFPHQVSLRRSWSNDHFCGGSIVSSRLVVTAAHCLYMNGIVIQPWMTVVVGGQIKLDTITSTTQKVNVKSYRIHPHYRQKTYENDVAVLELEKGFRYDLNVRGVPLPATEPHPGTICQVSGWGYTSEDIRIVSNDLLYVDLPVISVEECRELLGSISEGAYCAGYVEGGRDSCQGDSGGGMICNGVFVGIVSVGVGCARPQYPGIYTNVFRYRNWISNGDFIEVIHYNESCHNSSEQKMPVITVITLSFFFVISIMFRS